MCSKGYTKGMQDAERYQELNASQRSDDIALLKEFCPRLQWRAKDTVLDVGCGPGDVTAEVLFPHLPSSATLCGVDISPSMVEHASQHYSSPRLQFKAVDMGSTDVAWSLPQEFFSKVFSFYCIHWIREQRQMASNLRHLLAPGGEALMSSVTQVVALTAYRILSQMDRWRPYMKDFDQRLSPLYGSATAVEEMAETLRAEGLEVDVCEERDYSCTFPSFDYLCDLIMVLNPCTGNIPRELMSRYRKDTESVVLEDTRCRCQLLQDSRVRIHYRALIVLCHKPRFTSILH